MTDVRQERAPGQADHSALPRVEPELYARGDEVARGGMGRIVEARDLRIGRSVALKELFEDSQALAARFEREARITARLQHPGIVPIYEIGQWPDGQPFYSMRLVQGRTLRAAIKECAGLTQRLDLLTSVIAAAEAVAYAHAQQVIHRDLSPANIMVGDFGETVVIDWGLAKDSSAESDGDGPAVGPYRAASDEGLTVHGAVIGTAAYMPPEQAAGGTVDKRADVYALGSILYHVLAGRAPYQASGSHDILELVRRESPVPIDKLEPGVPRDLASIVAKAMARDPMDRYADAGALVAELVRFRAGRMVQAHQYTRSELLRRWVRRNRAWVLAGTAIALVILIGGGLALASILRSSRRADAERATAVKERDAASAQEARARATTLALLEEQGRQELLAGDSLKALAYLDAALQGGRDTAAMRLMLGLALRPLAWRMPDLTCNAHVIDFVISPDGSQLAAICGLEVVGWSLTSGVQTYRTPIAEAHMVRFSADGAQLITDGAQPSVLDATTGAVVRTLSVGEPAQFVAFRGEELVVVTRRRIVRLDREGRVRASLPLGIEASARARPITALTPDGKTLVVGSNEGHFETWDLVQSRRVAAFAAPARVWSIDVSRDGTSIATCGDGQVVTVFAIATGRIRWSNGGQRAFVSACRFDPSGTHLLMTASDGRVEAWDLASELASFRISMRLWAADAFFTSDGTRVAVRDEHNVIEIRSTATGHLVATLPTRATHMMFTPDDRMLVVADRGTIERWNIGETRQPSFVPPETHQLVEVSMDGRRALTVTSDLQMALWDVATGARLDIPALTYAAGPTVRSLSRDGSRLVGLADERTVVLVDVDHPLELTRHVHVRRILVCSIDENGAQVSATDETSTTIWRTANSAPLTLTGQASGASWSRDGRRVALSTDAGVTIYSLDGEPPIVLPATGARYVVGFDASGQRVAVMQDVAQSGVGDLVLWEIATQKAVLSSLSASGAFDPSGHLIASYGRGTIEIWDASAGTVLRTSPVAPPDQDGYLDPSPVPGEGATLVLSVSESHAVEVRDGADGRVLARLGEPRARFHVDGRWIGIDRIPPRWLSADRVVTASGDVSVWTLPREQRPAAEIHRIVSEYVPWRVERGQIVAVMRTLRGRVLRGTAGVPNALVLAKQQPLGSPFQTHTNADGSYLLDRLPEGTYVVTASDGSASSAPLTVRSDSQIDLALP